MKLCWILENCKVHTESSENLAEGMANLVAKLFKEFAHECAEDVAYRASLK